MASKSCYLIAFLATVLTSVPIAAATISTPFGGANGGNDALYFDLINSSTRHVRISGEFELNLGGIIDEGAGAGLLTDVSAYYRPGSRVGFEGSAAGWNFLATINDVSVAGNNRVTSVDFGTGFVIPPGETYALALFESTPGNSVNLRYDSSDPSPVGTVLADDGTLQVLTGASSNALFSATVIEPRGFKGSISYYFINVSQVPLLSPIGLIFLAFALLLMSGFRPRLARSK